MHDDNLVDILLRKRKDTQLLILHLEKQIDQIDELVNSLEITNDFLYPQPAIEVSSAIVKADLDPELLESIRNGGTLPVNPAFAEMKFIDAVEKILLIAPESAMHRDYVLRKLYADIVWENPELRQIAGKRLSAIFNEGKNQGRWEKIPGEPCYQLYQKKK